MFARVRLPARLRPPDALRARLCWIMLVVSLWVIGTAVPMLIFASPQPAPQRALAILGLGWLAWSQVRAYRRGFFPRGDRVLDGLVIGLAAATAGDFRSTLGLFYVPLFFRCMYGSVWDVALTLASFIGAYIGAGLGLPLLQGLPPRVSSGEIANNLMGFINTGFQMKLVSVASLRHERAANRERSLAAAGGKLVAATDRAQLEAAALEAVQLLLGQTRVLRTLLAVLDDNGQATFSAAGVDAERVHGLTIDPRHIPPAHNVVGSRKQQAFDNATAGDLEQALGFPLNPGVSTVTPLFSRDKALGVLIVESAEHLPSETADALATLASQIALALDSVRLTEDLRHDISRREALEAQLRELAYQDPLTGLANRALLMRNMEQALARVQTRRTHLAVLFLDLDNFKIVNDSLGHRAGDQLLVQVARRLRSCVRPFDTVARLGGDEFTVLLEDLADPAEAERVAERIRDQLRAPVLLEGRPVTVTGSIGIALRDADHRDAGDLLRAADLALYAAKDRGKAQAALFEPAMVSGAMARLELEADLRQAIERGELELHYQPLVRFEDGRLAELEALVRWRHPRRGLVGPNEFIPLAEETGLIVPLGQWVLETACRQAREWQQRFDRQPGLIVSVNLSGRQLSHPTLVDDVRHVLETTGLEPGLLKLEITESVAVADTSVNVDTLWGLRELGVQLAIDDFGTGSSALNYLRRFPVDTLKIDRSYIEDLGRDLRTTAMVRGIIAFAKSLGLKVTGEGVETAEQSDHLRAMGCDWGQGYLFARPVAPAEIEALLAEPEPPAAELPRAA